MRKMTFDDVFRLEVERLRLRPHAAQPFGAAPGGASVADAPSTGLALSGGGIRSAAFALGVMQALEAADLFSRIDFLSTVSGGGYAGAALVAGLRRGNGAFPFKTNSGEPRDPADIADNEAVQNIRDHSRYLMPRGRFDLVVSLAIIMRGLLVNAVFVGCLLSAMAAVTLMFFPSEDSLSRSPIIIVADLASTATARAVHSWLGTQFVLTKVLLVAFTAWLLAWAIFCSFTTTAKRASDKLLSDALSPVAKASAAMLVLIAIVLLIEVQQPVLSACLRWFGTPQAQARSYLHLKTFMTALAAGTGLVGLFWRFIIQAIQSAEREASWSALVQGLVARVALVIAAGLLPALIYCAYLILVIGGLERPGEPARIAGVLPDLPAGQFRSLAVVLPMLAIAAYVATSATWGPLSDTVLNRSWWRSAFRTRSFMIGLALVVAIVASGYLFALYLATPLALQAPLTDSAWAYAGLGSCLAAIAVLFTENSTSLHRLYRDRLQEAFSIDDGKQRLILSELGGQDDGSRPKPYPIVNATVNIQASRKNRRGRNADFFVFTPDVVGSDATGYADTTNFEAAEPHMDLATAVAVSGAAISSSMGRAGVALLTPTLTLLNLRLGLWIRNPRFAQSPEDRSAASKGDVNLGYILREVFGRLTEDSRKVYVTDGGHIDNLGLHQLLKRRCEFIIVSDAEQDPSLTFSGFVDVERFARIDLGVRFDLPLAAIREAALKRNSEIKSDPSRGWRSPASAHAAIGTIQYPKSVDGLPPKEGTILYVKACMTGDERGYVVDYERRFPKFPHEPTSDQFFSEEQFEAYRALGFHAASGAVAYSDGTERWTRLLQSLRTRLQAEGKRQVPPSSEGPWSGYHQPARTGATVS